MKKDAKHRRTDTADTAVSANDHAPTHHLTVLVSLGRALLTARVRDENPWQRATPLADLAALGLTPAECRELVSKDLIEVRNSARPLRQLILAHAHARTSRPDGASPTQSRPRSRKPVPTLKGHTRVILTEAGLAFLMSIVFRRDAHDEPSSPGHLPTADGNLDINPILPHYATDLRELSVTGEVIVRLSVQARSLATVLTTLQTAGWPSRVEKPLNGRPGGNDPHHLTIAAYKLNARQSLIHFRADDGALRWNWRSKGALLRSWVGRKSKSPEKND